MSKLLALLFVLAVSACDAGTSVSEPRPQVEQRAAASSPVPGTPTSSLSATSPTRPYLLAGRMHVGSQVVPGRYVGAVVRGKTWLAWRRWEGRRDWGTDASVHHLPAVNAAQVSPDGRFIATVSGGEHCEGVRLNREHEKCAVSLLDTSGSQPPRRLVVGRTVVLVGVSEQGGVVLTEGADRGWDELIWDPAGGADGLVPIEGSPEMQQWAMHDWEPGSFGVAGFEFFAPNVSQRWLGELVDGQVRPRVRLPEDVEPGPGGAWVLSDPWSRQPRDLEGALEKTVPSLTARTLGADGGLGPRVRLEAPTGWFFAEATTDETVFWEDADTFVARVVDSRQSGDRLARCDLPAGSCVLVESAQ
jgi:hypothetical protein